MLRRAVLAALLALTVVSPTWADPAYGTNLDTLLDRLGQFEPGDLWLAGIPHPPPPSVSEPLVVGCPRAGPCGPPLVVCKLTAADARVVFDALKTVRRVEGARPPAVDTLLLQVLHNGSLVAGVASGFELSLGPGDEAGLIRSSWNDHDYGVLPPESVRRIRQVATDRACLPARA